MEQMQNVATGLERLVSVQTMIHGASLLGKTVEGSAMDDPSQIVSGEVTEVVFSGGEVVLTVDGVKVKLTDVSGMKSQAASS
jgi:flagellar hook assembly protein FlgD